GFGWDLFLPARVYLSAGATRSTQQCADRRSFAASGKRTEQRSYCSPAADIFSSPGVRADPRPATLTGVYGKQIFAVIHRHRAQVQSDIFAALALDRNKSCGRTT